MFNVTIFDQDNKDVTNNVLPDDLNRDNVASYFTKQGKAVYHGHTGYKGDIKCNITLLFVFNTPVSDILTCEEKPIYTIRLESHPAKSTRFFQRYSTKKL